MSEQKPSDLDAPDLKTLLAEASPPSETVTVPLKQGLAERIRAAEAELGEITTEAPGKRMAAKSPLKAKAEEIEALRAEMSASALTFHFSSLTHEERDEIRREMGGRDEPDEVNLRAIAAMCRTVTDSAGRDLGSMSWVQFRDLRSRIGAQVFDLTIDAAATRASGGEWSVPFSFAASRILGMQT